jgi:hypothetical protein
MRNLVTGDVSANRYVGNGHFTVWRGRIGSMTIIQLLITIVAVIGVVVIVLLAIIPSLLDYRRGLDKDAADPGAPTPIKSDDHRGDSMNLAA